MTEIAIDFDGTISDHDYPRIGRPVPGAIEWIKQWKEAGAAIYLWTMRCGAHLDEAVAWCREQGLEFHGVNENPSQKTWTQSPKLYANFYIDDAAFGCPLVVNPRTDGRPYVDWSVVGPAVLEKIKCSPTSN